MIVGIPKEIKANENRVSITPAGVHAFIEHGHKVIIQKDAGANSGISDEDYILAGASIEENAAAVFAKAEMIMKVKEPQASELEMMREGQIIYTYLHLAPDEYQVQGFIKNKAVGIAYETIEVDGKLPLLEPMSEVAGKMSSLVAAYHLARPYGGSGILPGGVAGVHSANFLVIGGGTAGMNAAKIAAGLGANVSIMDINLERLRYLEDILPANCETLMSNKMTIEHELANADVVICAVLIPGAKAPKLITRDMLKLMKPKSVIVDISIDQGGCLETSKQTTHASPVYEVDGVLHYCVSNMPGAYAKTSTYALTNATLPFGLFIADKGWKLAAYENAAIAKGINVALGNVTCKPVADAQNIKHVHIQELF